MSYSRRTVRTIVSDGRGPPRVETKTYSYGDPDGAHAGFSTSGGLPSSLKFGFGGKTYDFGIGGGGGDSGGDEGGSSPRGGGGGFRISMPSAEKRDPVVGRASRKERKNPFSGVMNQNYDDVKKKCLEEGILFEDPEFPARDDTIFFSKAPPRPFEWKRPKEISDAPQFIAEGASRFDVQQGELGDCWLLAAVASLTINKKLFDRVCPPQDFGDDYCGLFKFNIWHQGEWVEVIVDDRLPTYYDQLVFMHSADKAEFWSALLEKAYAKLQGSYESLKGGSSSEAMEDFTGGITEMIDLKKAPDNLLKIMMKAGERESLMGCSIDPDPNQTEAELANGLIMGHAYSVTAVKLVDIQTPRSSGKIPLIRVRNPWGNEAEWKGAWSDKSEEWRFIPDDQKETLGLTFDSDGEFWMSFQDFCKNFEKLEICNLSPDATDTEEGPCKKKWSSTCENGKWTSRVNAGGCRNYLDTFWTNPQFQVTLTDVDDDDDDETCTMLVGVLQKDRRKKRKEGLDLLTMGYVIYKADVKIPNFQVPNSSNDSTGNSTNSILSDRAQRALSDKIEFPVASLEKLVPPELADGGQSHLDMKFFKYNASVAKSPAFINLREICGRHKLPPGTYAIIPSTFEPHQDGDFLLRIFTEKANETMEIDEQTSLVEPERKQVAAPAYHPAKFGRGTERDFIYPAAEVAPVASLPPGAKMFPEPRKRREVELSPEEQQQDQALKATFRSISGDDLEIDAYELKDILNAVFTKDFPFDGFGIDATRSMVAMHDGDLSGKLGYDEFKVLWKDLRRWKSVYQEFDHDKSGTLSSYELRAAMTDMGFRLSNKTLSALVMRYSNRKGEIDFGDFIQLAIKLKTMIASFKNVDAESQGLAAFDIDSFIETTMYS